MKFISFAIIVSALFMSATMYAQQAQQPSTSTDTGSTNSGVTTSPNTTPTTPGTNPAPSSTYQTTPQSTPGTNQTVTQPFGTTPSNDPFQNQQPESTTQPYNDYHLTRPSTSPMSGQIGTQNGNAPAVTPQPYNQDPGTSMQVEKSQLPAQMLQNLEDPRYTGWENSTIYYNRGSNQYSFDVGTGGEIKNYRFDRDGNPIQQTPAGGQQ